MATFAQVVSEVDVESSSVVTCLVTTMGSSSSKCLYIASHEENLECVVHVVSENNGGISVTSVVGGAGYGGIVGYFLFLVALDISPEFGFSGLACNRENTENKEQT